MILPTLYRDKKIGVFGLGKAGKAAVAALVQAGAEVYTWDDKAPEAEGAKLEAIENWPWQTLQGVVLSPGVPFTHPEPHPVVKRAKAENVPILGEVDVLYGACPNAFYVGITGTNGKSTTTSLTAHILTENHRKVQVGGNLGTPALALEPLGEGGWYVLEMSSYQLELTCHTRFNAAVLLNLTPDHLDRHGDMAGYIKAKKRIFDRQQPGDVALIALDDSDCRNIYADDTPHAQPFTVTQELAKGVVVDANGVLHDYTTSPVVQFDLSDLRRLKGRHNWQNIAAAYSVCRYAGLEGESIMNAVYTFPGPPHRLEIVGESDGISFINDSKATNADATQHALAPFDTIYWILGGKPKTGGIESLTPYFSKISHAFLLGEAENAFAETLASHQVPFTKCGNLETATHNAASMALSAAKPGAVVLLSPACASFDQWKSFEQRGDAFRDYVQAIINNPETKAAV